VNRLASSTHEVQRYFPHAPKLAKEFPWEVCLAYMFARVELAHNMAIYCGTVKLHRADAELARKAVMQQHMTREGFRDLFKAIYQHAIPDAALAKLADAEGVRDKVLHGKSASDGDMRKAVVRVVEYAEAFNAFSRGVAGVMPFDDLRGFKGRAKSLDKSTTRWLLKGMGFDLS
jgi:hypothetical protein